MNSAILKDIVEKLKAVVGRRGLGRVGYGINPLGDDLEIEVASVRIKGLGSMKGPDKEKRRGELQIFPRPSIGYQHVMDLVGSLKGARASLMETMT